MRLGHGLHIEQTQKLIMTPELRQAIAILQLSAPELSLYVEEQLLENPLLEIQEESPESGENTEPDFTGDNVEPEFAGVNAEPELRDDKKERTGDKWEVDWQEYFQDQEENAWHMGRLAADGGLTAEERQRVEPLAAASPTLTEHLLEQLHVQKISVPVAKIAEYIVGNLDDSGYLPLTLEDLVRETGASGRWAAEALVLVQGLDPLGVGARNLEECLRLQLPLLPGCPPEMTEVLKYLEDLAAGRLQRIAAALKVPVSRVQEMRDLVRKLDPRPGLRFSKPGEMRYIVPDVVVEEIEGEFLVLVNDITVPRLRINKTYREALSQEKGSDTRNFVEQKLNAAVWLIRSIEQRRLTLYKVAVAIAARQAEFLRQGIRCLQPLTLKDIAEEVGVHESTVSRAASHKYMQTPRGIFELKFFFTGGVSLEHDAESKVATEWIKVTLRDMIASEDPRKPFSDQKLTDLLKSQGIDISRRTAAKYRSELRIPAALARKRY